MDVDPLEGEGPGGMVRKTRRATGEGVDAEAGRPGRGARAVTFGAPLEGRYEPPDWG